MDARPTGRLAGGIRERGGPVKVDHPTMVNLIDRAGGADAHERRVRAGTARVLAEYELLQRRIRIGHRPAP